MADTNPPAPSGNQNDARAQLGAIPFGHLIGAPMNAAIEAQAKAATTSLDFIKTLTQGDNKNDVPNITFKYKKDDQVRSLEVPILTIVPIPYLRIDNMSIGFKASISASTEQKDTNSSSTAAEAKMSASASYWFAKAELSASVSSKKDSSSTRDSKYSVEYTIDINVHAVQDDMPAGLSKVLNILSDSINSGEDKKK